VENRVLEPGRSAPKVQADKASATTLRLVNPGAGGAETGRRPPGAALAQGSGPTTRGLAIAPWQLLTTKPAPRILCPAHVDEALVVITVSNGSGPAPVAESEGRGQRDQNNCQELC